MTLMARSAYTAMMIAVFGTIAAMPVWIILTWAGESGIIARTVITSPDVPAGGSLQITGYVIVPGGCRAVLVRRAYDSGGVLVAVLGENVISNLDATPARSARTMPIPGTASPGPALLTQVVEWACNWPQRLFPRQRGLRALEFTITPPG